MFKFLKDKLKSAIGKLTGAVEKEPEQEIEVPKPRPEDFKPIEPVIVEKPKEIQKPEASKEVHRPKIEIPQKPIPEVRKEAEKPKPIAEKKEEIKVPRPPSKTEEPKETLGFFEKLKQAVTTKKLSEDKFDELFWDLEVALLENNVAFEVIEKIKADLKKTLVDAPLKRGEVEEIVVSSLKDSISSLFDEVKERDIIGEIRKKKEKPYVIVFIGTNGSGKTTTIAKFANMLTQNGLKSVLAAGDTWRSAAIQQLEEHANKLNIPLVKHDYGADPAAISFDAIKMAQARNLDVVLIDTAGRQHSNINLIDEMKKIIRVAKPDLKVYIGEMIAGNDCIEQIQSFDKAIEIDGAILTKADIDEKGGTAISLSYVTKKPIFYLCTGQEYSDIEPFEKDRILKNLGF